MSQRGHMVVNILHIPQTCECACVVFSCVLNDAMDCWMAEWKKKITLQRRRAAQSPFVSQQMKIVQSKLSGEQKKKNGGETFSTAACPNRFCSAEHNPDLKN